MRDGSGRIHFLKDESRIQDRDLKAAYLCWQQAKGDERFPGGFDLLKVPSVVDHCAWIEILPELDLDHAVLRFAGTSLVLRNRGELVGKPLVEFQKYPNTYKIISLCGLDPRPMWGEPHRAEVDAHDHLTNEHLCLPISKDGKNISDLLYIAKFTHSDGSPA